MPTTTTLLPFAFVALGLVITPGPNMIYLISRSICQGRGAGLISLGGVALGLIFYMVCALLSLRRSNHDRPGVDRKRRSMVGWYHPDRRWRLPSLSRCQGLAGRRRGACSGRSEKRIGWSAARVAHGNDRETVRSEGDRLLRQSVRDRRPTRDGTVGQARNPHRRFALEIAWYSLVAVLFSTRPARAAFQRFGTWIGRAVGTVLAGFSLRLILERA